MTSAQNLPEYKVQNSRKPPEFTQPQQSSHFNSRGNGYQVGMWASVRIQSRSEAKHSNIHDGFGL